MAVYVWTDELKNAYIWEYVAPRTPWENTVAYYPLTSTSTVNDLSWNNRNLTNNWTLFGTYDWIDCAYFESQNSKKLYWTLPLSWNTTFTINVYVNRLWVSLSWNNWQIFVLWPINYSNRCCWLAIADSSSEYVNYTRWRDVNSSVTNTTWVWELLTVVNNRSVVKTYRNGVEIMSNTVSLSVNNTGFTVWSFPSTFSSYYQNFYWYMSELIVEDKARTAQEISDYYDLTKWDYWIS